MYKHYSMKMTRPGFDNVFANCHFHSQTPSKWLKQLKQKNSAPKEKTKVIKLKNGKVKKGSGFRYDKKKGYDRYWSSSEEETASSDDEVDEPEFNLPSAFGYNSVKLDVSFKFRT